MQAGVRRPYVVVIAGPNGAGKTTVSRELLPEGLPFVNADNVARELAPTVVGHLDARAGRETLALMNELIRRRLDFAVESTLAGRSLAVRLGRLRESGYRIQLVYMALASADVAVQRVADRVRRGGHSIPETVIRRRYAAGLVNLFALYLPLADHWQAYDNTGGKPALIAEGWRGSESVVRRGEEWERLRGAVEP